MKKAANSGRRKADVANHAQEHRSADRRRQHHPARDRPGADRHGRARPGEHPARLREFREGQSGSLGPDHECLWHPPAAAVRRLEGQERDRHGDDDRCDRPAVSRQGGRVRHHDIGQRLHPARHAAEAGRHHRLRLRRIENPAGVQIGLHPLHRYPTADRKRTGRQRNRDGHARIAGGRCPARAPGCRLQGSEPG